MAPGCAVTGRRSQQEGRGVVSSRLGASCAGFPPPKCPFQAPEFPHRFSLLPTRCVLSNEAESNFGSLLQLQQLVSSG